MEFQRARRIRKGSLALYDLCDHNLCTPAVIPRALITYTEIAER